MSGSAALIASGVFALRPAASSALSYPTMLTKVARMGMLTKASTVVTKVPWAMTRELPPYW